MARSQETFNKREREKQRIKKAQEKQEKMKERKENKEKGTSLEDMMAYLDENGNLTTTPPNPGQIRKTFRQEEIQISVPKQEDRPAEEARTGVVAFFNDHKGFGFINDAQTGERIFVHVNNLSGPIKEHDKVTFEVERSPKGFVAVNVVLIK
ncbi:cold shock domain-containing protein [Paraflavitalea soli]|uniref:Cold shock domain-containing protein n=1 Tax=Paraflavitalea soli TaxID=2315862 RepID=A0A3B7MHE9_9BACT|nr:cold shock domain-containing protein [Paraflavitalea soli]AXY72579.1 cold shock domain-containing protein [Paraflavitalea soli]